MIVWGIVIRNGFDELDDPWYHRGITQHAYLEGNDKVALCGFRPPLTGSRGRVAGRASACRPPPTTPCAACAPAWSWRRGPASRSRSSRSDRPWRSRSRRGWPSLGRFPSASHRALPPRRPCPLKPRPLLRGHRQPGPRRQPSHRRARPRHRGCDGTPAATNRLLRRPQCPSATTAACWPGACTGRHPDDACDTPSPGAPDGSDARDNGEPPGTGEGRAAPLLSGLGRSAAVPTVSRPSGGRLDDRSSAPSGRRARRRRPPPRRAGRCS